MAAAAEIRSLDLSHFLAQDGELPLLRISTAGSVDDGKSTLIGRLLYDTKAAWDDHLEEVGRSKVNRSGRTLDLSLLTDGLRAEREQGITIDVAYRYFATPRRKFIVADTPGHEQYTRNMATGASTADLAVILVDARKGLLAQSRRHSFIAWLLGVRRLVFAINKMDLVNFEESVYESVRRQAQGLLQRLDGAEAEFIPLCALDGDNVVDRSTRMPWYTGPSLLELLESVDPAGLRLELPFRMAVQTVIRPHLDFRGFAGQISSGRVRVGDEITALPGGRVARVKRIVTFDGDLDEAICPMSVTIELDREIDISRGDLLAHTSAQPQSASALHAQLVWMSETPMEAGGTYLLQHGTRVIPARVKSVRHRWDVDHLHTTEASTLELNDIGEVEIESAEALPFDSYRANRATGGLILIDPIRNLTVAAGLIEGAVRKETGGRQRFSTDPFTPAERAALRALLAHMKKFGLRVEDFEEGEGI